MNELHLQDKFLIPYFIDGLGYKEVKANTVTNSLIIEEDLQAFISDTELNKKPYEQLLKKYPVSYTHLDVYKRQPRKY